MFTGTMKKRKQFYHDAGMSNGKVSMVEKIVSRETAEYANAKYSAARGCTAGRDKWAREFRLRGVLLDLRKYF